MASPSAAHSLCSQHRQSSAWCSIGTAYLATRGAMAPTGSAPARAAMAFTTAAWLSLGMSSCDFSCSRPAQPQHKRLRLFPQPPGSALA